MIERFATLPDQVILDRFNQMVEEGTWSSVFYLKDVTTARDFLSLIREKRIWGFFVTHDDRPRACVWLNNIHGTIACIHQWAFKAGWGHTQNLALEALEYIGSHTRLTGVCGQTPTHLPLALRLIKRRGFTILNTLKNEVKLPDGRKVDLVLSFFDLTPYKEESYGWWW